MFLFAAFLCKIAKNLHKLIHFENKVISDFTLKAAFFYPDFNFFFFMFHTFNMYCFWMDHLLR